MHLIEKHFTFDAGHQLMHHDGVCARPHGHTYHLVVKIRFEHLQTSGPKKNMGIDFKDISSVMKPLLTDYLDHHWLNDTLQTDSPTAEWIAQWIYEKIQPQLPGLESVTLFETPTSGVTYYVAPRAG